MSSKGSYNRNWRLGYDGRCEKHRIGCNWFKFQLHDNFPSIPCCYVVYLDGEPCYIGSTVNFYKRFTDHHHRIISKSYAEDGQLKLKYISKWGVFDDAYIKVRFSDFLGDWAQKEIYLINRIKPKFNKTYNW